MSTITPTQDKSSTGQACSGRPINSTQGGKIRICNSDISEKYLHERCCGLESSRELYAMPVQALLNSSSYTYVSLAERGDGSELSSFTQLVSLVRSLPPSLAHLCPFSSICGRYSFLFPALAAWFLKHARMRALHA